MASPTPVTLSMNEVAWLVGVWGRKWFKHKDGDDIPTAVALIMAESGGNTGAINPASNNAEGGDDIGLFQINDSAEDDREARLNAYWNFIIAVNKMAKDGTDWTCWLWWPANGGPSGPCKKYGQKYGRRAQLDLASARVALSSPVDASAKLKAAGHDTPDKVGIDDIPKVVGGVAGDVVDAIPGVGALTDWAVSLGRLLSVLLEPTFWRRIGIGAFGLLLLLIAVSLANGGSIVKALT